MANTTVKMVQLMNGLMAPKSGICTENDTAKVHLPLNMLKTPKCGICTTNGIVKMVLPLNVQMAPNQWWLHNVRYYENAEAWAEAVLKSRNEMHDVQNVDAFLKTVLRNQLQQSL
jgi:hypothetical protein